MESADQRVPERVALFASVCARNRMESLLEGLSDLWRERARIAGKRFLELSSADRQALVVREFGPRPDARERLRQTLAEAPAELCAAIQRASPLYLRSLLPPSEAPALPPPLPDRGPVRRHALRKLKEATR